MKSSEIFIDGKIYTVDELSYIINQYNVLTKNYLSNSDSILSHKK